MIKHQSMGLTSLCSALLSLVDQQVARALRAERQDQVLCQSRDKRQGQHHGPVMLCTQDCLKTSHLQQTKTGTLLDSVTQMFTCELNGKNVTTSMS